MTKTKGDIFKLLDNIKKEDDNNPTFGKYDKVLLIDGLNLFMRNFAMINFINENGVHTGGLGGFLRSLGSLINLIKPTSVYIVFDGIGSSINRKNIHPEYKSGRNITRMTNFSVFENLDEENDSKIDQIVRLIHYLKCLPVKTISLDKVEADDIIAYLSSVFSNEHNSKVYIVSADQDFTQLVNDKITLYKPVKKEFITPNKVKEEYGVLVENFILYKTLLGDNSDKIEGIKGLGKKGLTKKFPELMDSPISLDDLYKICEQKYKEHIVYSRVLYDFKRLEMNYKIMDLKNPLVDDKEKNILRELIKSPLNDSKPDDFMKLYGEDGLNNTIKNPTYWLKETFGFLNSFK
jgi:DNA polymerase-1